MQRTTPYQSPFYIILLVLAGEAVFILPFVLARVFRATVLDVFQITNTELGYCFSIYGIVALISYIIGGPLADKYPPKSLMGIGLILTALGGIVYASNPSLLTLQVLYGFWGFTTIFLFWAAMIKATRVWGGVSNQGKAFGFLDGGRGLVGASFGLLGVVIFSLFIVEDNVALTSAQQVEAFQTIVYASSAIVALVGIIVLLFLKTNVAQQENNTQTITLDAIKTVLKLPSVWLLMIIILCAYVGYKITDIFSLYAKDVMNYSEVDAAKTGTFLLFIRPLVGVIVGFLADRSRASLYLCMGFALSIIGAILFASDILSEDTTVLFFLTIIITALGVYAARVLYFAVMQEGKIPLKLTGTAVGIISFIGYTPDIFAGPMIGYYLDGIPGKEGHFAVFWMLAIFSAVGLVASIAFYRFARTE
ncbi:MFS transporter [Dokdonia donghaensis]|uniref:MFS transporter permease n=1 Tax=Dokdonia donghaensis DSW-1 TaxID=1300343 RepID=A0A0A2GQS0_9FLAO|nr:MFS transporter [Dokdonia donghaensis]ANH61142.1 Inner membrane protein YqcE [Dokdonia donghaensis DSW-1]KGO05644.1 MFS transporter permease [Dokdonia donghaensis DSW-1]